MRKAGRVLVIQLRTIPDCGGMTRARGTKTHKTSILPLRSDDAYVVGGGATLNTRVFDDVQASPRTEGGIPLFQFNETTRRAEEPAPFLRQRIMTEARAGASEARATVGVHTKAAALATYTATSEASETARIVGKSEA